MGVMHAISELWPFAMTLGVMGAVVLAFTQCAMSHGAVVLAARLYSPSKFAQSEKREEWLGLLDAMKPMERPVHAGSLLWTGALHFLRRQFALPPLERIRYGVAVLKYCKVSAALDAKKPGRGYMRREFLNAYRKHTHDREFIDFFTRALSNTTPGSLGHRVAEIRQKRLRAADDARKLAAIV
jgi:hypothetical protein